MKQDVLITLKGTQSFANEKPETIELLTRGTMTGRNGKFAISYEETEMTGIPGVTTTFLVFNPKRIVLTREGAIHSRMVFEKDIQNDSLYDLGFGSLMVGICAKEIRTDLTEAGGSLFIDYVVDVEQSMSSRNSYEISVKPIKDDVS